MTSLDKLDGLLGKYVVIRVFSSGFVEKKKIEGGNFGYNVEENGKIKLFVGKHNRKLSAIVANRDRTFIDGIYIYVLGDEKWAKKKLKRNLKS